MYQISRRLIEKYQKRVIRETSSELASFSDYLKSLFPPGIYYLVKDDLYTSILLSGTFALEQDRRDFPDALPYVMLQVEYCSNWTGGMRKYSMYRTWYRFYYFQTGETDTSDSISIYEDDSINKYNTVEVDIRDSVDRALNMLKYYNFSDMDKILYTIASDFKQEAL